MEWKLHLRRVILIGLVLSVILGLVIKAFPRLDEQLPVVEIPVTVDVPFEEEVVALSGDPCRATASLEVATGEFGTQGCWVVERFGDFGFRTLLVFLESDEFRGLFDDLGPNILVPLLGYTLANPDALALFEGEDKVMGFVRIPVEEVKSRWDAAANAKAQGARFLGMVNAALKPSGVTTTAVNNAKKEYSPLDKAMLLLYMAHQGRGSFLDQFHITYNKEGGVAKIDVQYSEHVLHIVKRVMSSGVTTFEKKYRWERATPADAGWALLDLTVIGGSAFRIVKIGGKAAKVAHLGKPAAAAGKAAKASRRIVTTKRVVTAVKVVGGVTAVGAVTLFPRQTFKWAWNRVKDAGDAGTWLLGQFIPEWLARIFGPFLGVALALALLYPFLWPLVRAFKIVKRLAIGGAKVATPFCRGAYRWVCPKRSPSGTAVE